MTQGLVFLFSMLVKGAAAALLGLCLHGRFNLSRFSASVRAGAGAVIGTGATHPLVWMGFPLLQGWAGNWWEAALLGQVGVILVETLFYAAVLRGYWLWSLVLSGLVNAVAFGADFLLTNWLGKAATVV